MVTTAVVIKHPTSDRVGNGRALIGNKRHYVSLSEGDAPQLYVGDVAEEHAGTTATLGADAPFAECFIII